jgi:alpha-1,2-glucosyltransferase
VCNTLGTVGFALMDQVPISKARQLLLDGTKVHLPGGDCINPAFLWLTPDLLDLCWCKGATSNLATSIENETIIEVAKVNAVRSTHNGNLVLSLADATTLEFEGIPLLEQWSTNIDLLLNGQLAYVLQWNEHDIGTEINLFHKKTSNWLPPCNITGFDSSSHQHKLRFENARELFYDLSNVHFRVVSLSLLSSISSAPATTTTATTTTSATAKATTTNTPASSNKYVLRPFHQTDLLSVQQMCNDFEIAKNLRRIPHPYTKDSAQYFLDHVCTSATEQVYAVEYSSTTSNKRSIIGAVSLSYISAPSLSKSNEPVLGIWIKRLEWRKGHATQCLSILLSHAFHNHADAITAEVFDENVGSMLLLRKKFGFNICRQSTTGTSMARPMEKHIPTTHLRLTRMIWEKQRRLHLPIDNDNDSDVKTLLLPSLCTCPTRLILIAAIFIAISSWLTVIVSSSLNITDPDVGYMDEIFHVKQTQLYCTHLNSAFDKTSIKPSVVGMLSQYFDRISTAWRKVPYDDKITTPPGLYAFASLILTVFRELALSESGCEPGSLRYINIAFQVGTLFVLHQILSLISLSKLHRHRHQHPSVASTKSTPLLTLLHTCVLSTSPVHFFCGFLFYTDAASTFFTLLSYFFALKETTEEDQEWNKKDEKEITVEKLGKFLVVVFVGLSSLACRQNNVIWSAFFLGTVLVHHVDRHRRRSLRFSLRRPRLPTTLECVFPFSTTTPPSSALLTSSTTPPFTTTANNGNDVPGFVKEMQALAKFLATPSHLIAWICSPTVLGNLVVIFTFVYCFIRNEYSVVLGDRDNHVPILHVSQLLYFTVFVSTVLSTEWLVLSKDQGVTGVIRTFAARGKGWIRQTFVCFVVLPVFAGLSVHYASPIHPFMLADNRHYVFYLWKNMMRRGYVRYFLVPVYVALGWGIIERLRLQQSSLWCFGLLICTALVLIPAHLVEFRYFTVPAMLWQVHMLGGGVGDRGGTEVDGGGRRRWWSASVTMLVHVATNIVVMWIFLHKTFQAPDGSVSRFMF